MSEEEMPLFSLFRIGTLLHNFNKKSEEKVGLSLVQWCLLKRLIDMPGTSAHTLAKSVGIQPSTLTQTLKRLERKRFIYQIENPRDSRKKVISITKSGKQTMERVADQMHKWSNCLIPLGKDLRRLNSFLQEQISESNHCSHIDERD